MRPDMDKATKKYLVANGMVDDVAYPKHSGGSTASVDYYAKPPHHGTPTAILNVRVNDPKTTGEEVARLFAAAPRLRQACIEADTKAVWVSNRLTCGGSVEEARTALAAMRDVLCNALTDLR